GHRREALLKLNVPRAVDISTKILLPHMYPALWAKQLRQTRDADTVAGLERIVCVSLVLLRIISLTYWLLSLMRDPLDGSPRTPRARFIEVYVFVQLAFLAFLWRMPGQLLWVAWPFAAYLLFLLFLSLLNIVFLAKIPKVNGPPVSAERSLLLLGVNAIQVVLCFAIFYREIYGFAPGLALNNAVLVLGTVGHPMLNNGKGGYVVALQVLLDLALLVLFIASLTGSLVIAGRAKRGSGPQSDN
ncbi:MAG: hypothetical protein JWQ83_1942, partial [Lacunisphaera sp.]|nr:hypothetical protein [Lacunisphaera sp.]